MTMQPWPGPRRSAEAESARRGRADFVAACALMAVGAPVDDRALVLTLGGPPAISVLAAATSRSDYWFRVWALRGLLWVWDDGAVSALATALGDEHWRVREMAAKIVARHVVDDALPEVAALQTDPVPRVRAAAARALRALVSAE